MSGTWHFRVDELGASEGSHSSSWELGESEVFERRGTWRIRVVMHVPTSHLEGHRRRGTWRILDCLGGLRWRRSWQATSGDAVHRRSNAGGCSSRTWRRSSSSHTRTTKAGDSCGAEIEEAEVNERGLVSLAERRGRQLPRWNGGRRRPRAGEERRADQRHGEDADPAGAAPGMRW